MSDKFDLILQKLQTFDQQFQSIDKQFRSIDKQFQSIDQRFQSIDQQFQSLNQRVDKIETEQQRHGDLLVQLIGIVKSTNEKLSGLQTEVSVLVKSQEKQDKILESLALRSLEQETEIREIKRIK